MTIFIAKLRSILRFSISKTDYCELPFLQLNDQRVNSSNINFIYLE
jgi:hypothetical protein